MNRIEFSRHRRLWFPQRYDHAAWVLMNVLGRWWLLFHGWKREYKICDDKRCIIVDFGHPKLMLAMEADGDQYHRDIVHEYDRDEILHGLGWGVRHYRYERLKSHSGRIRGEVKRWYWKNRIIYMAEWLRGKLS